MSEDSRENLVKKDLYIRDIRVQCAEKDANLPGLDDLNLVIVKDGERYPFELTRISKTMWRCSHIDRGLFLARRALKFLVTLNIHGDVRHTESNLSQYWEFNGDEHRNLYMRGSGLPVPLVSDLKGGMDQEAEDTPVLSIFLQVCEAGAFETALKNMEDSEETDSLALLLSEALLTPDSEFRKPYLFYDIGDVFDARFAKSQGRPDIDACIQAYDRALRLLSAEDDRLVLFSNDVGAAYFERYHRFGAIDDINEAIKRWQLALPAITGDDPMTAPVLNNLGISFLSRFQHSGNFDDLTKSIRLHQQVSELIPEEDPDYSGSLNSLANSFSARFQYQGDYNDLVRSIQLQQQVVDLTPKDHPDFPPRLGNLGVSFFSLFEETGDLNDLAQSIQLQQQVVDVATDQHPDLPAWLNNLGNSFSRRFERTGSLDDLRQSIQLKEEALERTPDGHPYMSIQLNNLGNSLLSCFQQTGSFSHLERSIQLMKQAVELTPEGSTDLPTCLNNLGNSLLTRFEQTNSLDDLMQSIRVTQQAIELTPEEHPTLPARLHNLGNSFSSSFKQTGNLEDLMESIQLEQRAVQLMPEGHPDLTTLLFSLGISFQSHFDKTDDHHCLLAAASNFRCSAMSKTGSPLICLKVARLWALLSAKISVSEVMNAYERIINLISIVAGMENTAKRRHEILKEFSELSAMAAAAALSIHQPSKALEWLEEGRCVVWNQVNQLRSPVDDLRSKHPELADQLESVSAQLENMQARDDHRQVITELSFHARISLETEARNHLRLSKEREVLLTTIRETPGFESFLRPRTCADLMKVIPDDGVVVIVTSDESRCDALILIPRGEGPTHIRLEKFSHERAQKLAEALREYLVSHHLHSRYAVSREAVPDTTRKLGALKGRRSVNQVKNILRDLWTDLVDPILQTLDFKNPRDGTVLPRIWWCPTGPFAFLPIHAAGIYDPELGTPSTCLADCVVSSYIPNLGTLDRLKSRKTNQQGKGVLLVSQPNTPSLAPIPKTEEEIATIRAELARRHVDFTLFSDKDATVARVLGSMDSFSCIHLACHASQNIESPLESAIYLHDGKLEISDIMKKDMPNAGLAFLSACQTSAGVHSLPEEAVHLAAGMLTAGYRSVVATVWSISDRYAPEVAETFYKSLSDDGRTEGVVGLDITGSARALHMATQALRRGIDDGKEGDLLAWIPYVHYGI